MVAGMKETVTAYEPYTGRDTNESELIRPKFSHTI